MTPASLLLLPPPYRLATARTLSSLVKCCGVGCTRIVAAGHSQGGGGALRAARARPDLFDAVCPIMPGGGDVGFQPCFIITAENDKTVPPDTVERNIACAGIPAGFTCPTARRWTFFRVEPSRRDVARRVVRPRRRGAGWTYGRIRGGEFVPTDGRLIRIPPQNLPRFANPSGWRRHDGGQGRGSIYVAAGFSTPPFVCWLCPAGMSAAHCA